MNTSNENNSGDFIKHREVSLSLSLPPLAFPLSPLSTTLLNTKTVFLFFEDGLAHTRTYTHRLDYDLRFSSARPSATKYLRLETARRRPLKNAAARSGGAAIVRERDPRRNGDISGCCNNLDFRTPGRVALSRDHVAEHNAVEPSRVVVGKGPSKHTPNTDDGSADDKAFSRPKRDTKDSPDSRKII